MNVSRSDQGAHGLPAHVEVLSREVSYAFPDEWYDLNAETHFWFEWRLMALKRLLVDLGRDLSAPARALEIGCGTGTLRDQVERVTAWAVDGVDVNMGALARSRPGRGRTCVYDIFEERPELIGAYDYVLLFDVLEHIETTGPFIDCTLRYLKPGGFLVVNVPALPSLMSEYDTAAGHFRRYTIETLAEEFRGRDATVEAARYWGQSLVPLLMLRKVMVRGRTDFGEIINSGFRPPNQFFNAGLRVLARVETSLVARPPRGTSVLAALRATSVDALLRP
jgi:SAM-dependent methyltransferase